MTLTSLFLIAVGLSMDAFAVSICKGLSTPKAKLRHMLIVGAWFGGFQGLMPLIGFFLGALFYDAISAFDHWIAFGLLGIIGINMLKEAFDKEECENCGCDDLSVKKMFVMAVATSIDALAVGVTFYNMRFLRVLLAVVLIGVITFTCSAIGVKMGSVFVGKYQNKAQFAGGAILIVLGTKILLEGIGILA